MEDGRQVDIILENPMWTEVVERVSKGFRDAFKGDDDEKAWEARRRVLVLEELLTEFVNIQKRGAKAAKDYDEMKANKEIDKPTLVV